MLNNGFMNYDSQSYITYKEGLLQLYLFIIFLIYEKKPSFFNCKGRLPIPHPPRLLGALASNGCGGFWLPGVIPSRHELVWWAPVL